MKTFRLLTLITFALGVVLTLVGLLLKAWGVEVAPTIIKIALVVDAVFVLSLIAWVIKAMFSSE